MATGSTTNYSLPYPKSTDFVSLPADVQALATAVDTQLLTQTTNTNLRALKTDVPINLLTINQSSLETNTTGWTATNSTLSRSTAEFYSGTASLLITSSAAGVTLAATPSGTSGFSVSAGRVYTAVAMAKVSVASRSINMSIRWYDAAGTILSTSSTATTATNTGWVQTLVTAVAPTSAAFAQVRAGQWTAVAANELTYIDAIGLWEGAGGKWVLGQGHLDPATLGFYVDESVGRRIFHWDYLNSRYQMTYGDTGWRDMSASLTNGWTAGNILLRRMGNQSFLSFTALNGSAASADSFLTAPAGWARPIPTNHYVPMNITTTTLGTMMFASSAWSTPRAACTAGSAHISWPSSDAWPTTLLGTAYGVIPQ